MGNSSSSSSTKELIIATYYSTGEMQMDADSDKTDEELVDAMKKENDLQEERIADLMKESLAAGNPLEATIGSMKCAGHANRKTLR